MPFCESCGAEIKPGKNFCSNCGTPLPVPGPYPMQAGPAAASSPAPAQPAPLPQPAAPGQSRDTIIIAAVMGAVILGLVIFIGLPFIQGYNTGIGIPATHLSPPATPAGTASAASPDTLSPGTYSGAVSSASGPEGSIVYRSGVAYDRVFSRDYESSPTGVQEVFSYSLQKAPMIVECDMNPKIVSREQLVDIGKSTERYITSTYPDPNAWLTMKVINADTGEVVTTISFSKNYRGELKQTYTIRANGNYRFELTGSRYRPA